MNNGIEREIICYKMLREVYSDGAYSNIVLTKGLKGLEEKDRAYVTRLFYGVLENDIQLSFIISEVAEKRPKPAVVLIIKIGLYLLRFSSTPEYAAINKAVELSKAVGKKEVAGFVNAVLRKSGNVSLNGIVDQELRLSLCYNYPRWIVEKLSKRYGYGFTEQMLKASRRDKTHIRNNSFNCTLDELYKLLPLAQKTLTGCYTDSAYLGLRPSLYVVQSLASTLAVNFIVSLCKPSSVLDLCAAPGGKSVYLYELTRAKIISADVHPHRVELIKKYADAVGVRLTAVQNDATVYNSEWRDSFDTVLCDVPCTGSGVIGSKPDIALGLSRDVLPELIDKQKKILKNSALYVKRNGYLVYSTCSVLKDENEDVCEEFLRENPHFSYAQMNYGDGRYSGNYINLYPHRDNCDGFFVCAFKRMD